METIDIKNLTVDEIIILLDKLNAEMIKRGWHK